MPTIRNRAPVEMPWLICCRTDPLRPSGVSTKIPRVQKPRWLTEEYATSFFMSFCISDTKAPYRMAMIERTIIQLRTLVCARTSGKKGSEKRIKPYVPIFSRTEARITEPAVGASTCASGNQVWKGNIGTLMANAKKNDRNSSVAYVGPYCGSK